MTFIAASKHIHTYPIHPTCPPLIILYFQRGGGRGGVKI